MPHNYSLFYLGGELESGEIGFLGCMRFLEIGTERTDSIPEENNHGVINGSCSIQDRYKNVFNVLKLISLLYFMPRKFVMHGITCFALSS